MLITIITLAISAVLLVATYRMANDYRALKIEIDEFTVIVTHIAKKELSAITDKIVLINRELSDTSDGLPEVHVSVGIAYGEGKTGEELFRAADDALYEVKSSGKGGYIVSEK